MRSFAAMLILSSLALVVLGIAALAEPPKRRAEPLPSTTYRLTTGQQVVEFNTVHGDRCVTVGTAMTCEWRYRQ